MAGGGAGDGDGTIGIGGNANMGNAGMGLSGGFGMSDALAGMGIFGDPMGGVVGNQGGGPGGMQQIQPQVGLFQQPPRPPVTMMNSLFGRPISGLGVPSDLYNHLMKGKY
jgi:hypothetical protein